MVSDPWRRSCSAPRRPRPTSNWCSSPLRNPQRAEPYPPRVPPRQRSRAQPQLLRLAPGTAAALEAGGYKCDARKPRYGIFYTQVCSSVIRLSRHPHPPSAPHLAGPSCLGLYMRRLSNRPLAESICTSRAVAAEERESRSVTAARLSTKATTSTA